VEKEDEGTYVCRAENQFGAQHVSAFLTVTGIGQFRLLVQYVDAVVTDNQLQQQWSY